MKTLFIIATEVGALQTLTDTKTFESIVADKTLRTVIITLPESVEKCRQVCGTRNVIVEGIASPRSSLFEKALAFCARNGYVSGTHQIMQHRARLEGEERVPVWVKTVLATFIGTVRPLRAAIRALDLTIPPTKDIAAVFDTYTPDLVFSTIAIRATLDVPILREAVRRKIRTIGMTRSWDNLTTYGFIRVIPNHFFVQNDFMRDMCIALHDMKPEALTVVGTPAFDIYSQPELLVSREEFCGQMGIDPHKKIILYAAIGDFLFPKEGTVADVFEESISNGSIDRGSIVIFRPHPAFESAIDHVDSMKHVIGDTSTRGVARNIALKKNHTAHLVNSIYHCEVLVTAGSTMMIEGALLDKPVITIAFDGTEEVPYWFSIARFHTQAVHILALLKIGAVVVAHSKNELIAAIQEAFASPGKRQSERKALVERFAGPYRGHAAERLAGELLAQLQRVE